MSNSPLKSALERIAVAIGRIEAAASQPVQAATGHDPHLEARHSALRTEVGGALAALDAIILSTERMS